MSTSTAAGRHRGTRPLEALVASALLLAAAACAGGPARDADRAIEAAVAALRRGAIEEALAHADSGLELARAGDDQRRAHRLRLLRAEILLSRPDVKGAALLLDEAIPDSLAPLRARQQYLVARVQVARGSLKDALDTLAAHETPISSDPDLRLDAEVLAGQVLLRLGRWEEAEARLEAAVAAAAERGDRYREVLALNNLGMGLLLRQRFDQALSWFERVLGFTDLEDTSVYAIAMNNAGACYARLGRFDRAIGTQTRAVELHERRGAAGPYEQALGELGSTYLLLEDIPRAVPLLTKAFDVAARAGLHADAAVWARNLAAAHVHVHNWDEAERYNDEARRLTTADGGRRLTFSRLHAADIALGRGRDAEAARLYQELLSDFAAEPRARWAAHDGLAAVAKRSGDPRGAAAHLEAALEIIEQTRSHLLQTDYRISFVTTLVRFYRAYVDFLVERGEVERALAVADSSRGRVLAERHGVGPPAASTAAAFRRLAARSGSTLVSYWLGPERSYVWTVDARAVRLLQLPPAGEIERLVREHQASILNALADPAAAGAPGDRLYQLLVAPLRHSIPDGSPVIIVADGALHGLNFETLPVAAPRRHYWIEDAVIQVAPSLALLAADGPPAAPRSLLVIGDPLPRQPEFPALRYASTEMANIVRHFSADRTRSFHGDDATPDAYRAAAPERFSLVHFTAHAAPNADSPLDSAVILSGPDRAFKLYARDVADVPLQAELVTVSACRGAGERAYSGEGLVGFAWAFLRAGARRVVAGLWDVDDRSTAELMDQLYARLAAGDSPVRALRAAKLSLLTRGGTAAKPYYWGPFQLFTVSAR